MVIRLLIQLSLVVDSIVIGSHSVVIGGHSVVDSIVIGGHLVVDSVVIGGHSVVDSIVIGCHSVVIWWSLVVIRWLDCNLLFILYRHSVMNSLLTFAPQPFNP